MSNEKDNNLNTEEKDEIIDEVLEEESKNTENQENSNEIQVSNNQANNNELISCPKCGSTQVEFVTYQASSNFNTCDACCGAYLCGPIGLLCGIKNKTEAKTVRKCKNCGHEF